VLKAATAAGFDAVELRRVDFRRSFDSGMSNAEVLDLVRASGLPVAALGPEYGWILAHGDERERLFAVFHETCRNAVALGCDMLMSALGPGEGTIDEAALSVRRAGDIAGEFGLRLALEYQFQHPMVSSLDILRDIIARAGRPNVGLLLGAYHLQRGGRSGGDFAEIPESEIFYVQISDVPDAPPNAVPPVDRLPPGSGLVQWSAFLQALAEKNYTGYLSYEAPNAAHWERKALDIAREGAACSRRVLAQAFAEE